MFPVTNFMVEDVAAKTKPGKRRWNASFSPLEQGKVWCYAELSKLGKLEARKGFETFTERNRLGLKKSSSKLEERFDAHNIDSWVLANMAVGGHSAPDNTAMSRWIPLDQHRRSLHMLQPAKGGLRRRNGGTVSLGFKKGSVAKHSKYGLCYVGGNFNGKLSLHSLSTGARLTKVAKPVDVGLRSFSSFRFYDVYFKAV